MEITSFGECHIEQAARIALQNYLVERTHNEALPEIGATSDLAAFAANGLGVAALHGEKLAGFLCATAPFANAFKSTDAVGVFSPMGAHGALGGDRARVYARMYEAAAQKWALAGASSHAVCLYAHDEQAQAQFFRYGFGMRCADALREMDAIDVPPCEGYDFVELQEGELWRAFALERLLLEHLAQSPCFIRRRQKSELELLNEAREDKIRHFAAMHAGEAIALVSASKLGGETFICERDDMFSICHAYCLPAHRGAGVFQSLLNALIRAARADGFARLGVNFESINPAAWGFWDKHFSAYTYSVVRRVDEWAVGK